MRLGFGCNCDPLPGGLGTVSGRSNSRRMSTDSDSEHESLDLPKYKDRAKKADVVDACDVQ